MKQVLKHKMWLTFVLLLGTCPLMLTACKNATTDAPKFGSISDNNGVINFNGLSAFITIGAGTLDYPLGVQFSNNYLWVVDYTNHSLTQYTTSGNQVFNTTAGLLHPYGDCIDPKTGNVYVANEADDNVFVYNSAGQQIATIPGGSGIDNPSGVAVNATGTILYVSNFLKPSGSYYCGTYSIGGTASSPTYTFMSNFATSSVVDAPYAARPDSNGNVWVADYSDHQVVEFSSTGAVVQKLTSDLTGPTGLTITKFGDILVADYTRDWIVAFNSAGSEVGKFGNSSILSEPWDVTTDGAGDYYVADGDHSRIVGFH